MEMVTEGFAIPMGLLFVFCYGGVLAVGLLMFGLH